MSFKSASLHYITTNLAMKFTAASVVVASLAATVFAENKYNHTNAGVSNKTSDCKLGSGKLLGACGDCAKAIVDCAVNAEETCLLYTSPSPRDRG